jgi:plastocyanin
MAFRPDLPRVLRAGGLALLAGAACAAVPVGACAAAKAHTPAVYTVTIQQMAFTAAPPKVRVGDTIEWVNNDIFVHSATAKDKSFDVELKPKAHVRMTLTKAGTFPFACRYHPGMTGTLAVTN